MAPPVANVGEVRIVGVGKQDAVCNRLRLASCHAGEYAGASPAGKTNGKGLSSIVLHDASLGSLGVILTGDASSGIKEHAAHG